MTFWQAIQTAFSRYAQFYGRSGRPEFWYWTLFTILGGIVASIVDAVAFGWVQSVSPLSDLFGLITLVPGIAVSVRRLHDVDRSGWWFLLIFVPLIGMIVLIVWCIRQGTAGNNRFGPDPLEAGAVSPQPAA